MKRTPTPKRFRTMRDGVEISLAGGVALKPGNFLIGDHRCCDCGLTHRHRYRITSRGTLKLTSWRLPKNTARNLRGKK